MQRKAIIIGATGLVGQYLVKQLSEIYDTVIVVARRPLRYINASIHFYQVNDFDNLMEICTNVSVDQNTDAFSCLGTTLKKAGSKEQFYAIDYVVNAHFAELFVLTKTHYVLISALGAQANSKIFYNRVKGELEETIRGLDLYKVSILQPSLLIGQRNEGRMLEDIFQKAYTKLSHFIPKHFKYKPVTAEQVAHTMVEAAQTQTEKFEIYDNLRIQKTK